MALFGDVAIYDQLTDGDYRKEALICSYIWALSENKGTPAVPDVQASASVQHGFGRAALRLYRWALRDSSTGKINAKQVAEAIRSDYNLRRELGIPEKPKWGFVHGFLHAFPPGISAGDFTERLQRLRDALCHHVR